IFAFFGLLSNLTGFIISKISKITSKTKTNLDDEILQCLKAPIKLALLVVGVFLAVNYLWQDLYLYGVSLVKVIIVVAVLLGAFTIARIVKASFSWYVIGIRKKAKTRVDDTIFRFIRRFVNILIYVIALLVIFEMLGIEIGPMLAGLGIAGLAVALALQDTLANFFSAAYIAADHPIKIGDYVEVEGGVKGYVEDIGWRSTRIRMLPNNMVIIPNTKLVSSVITNYNSPKPEMGVVVPVGVSYGSNLEKVEKVTIEVAKKVLKKIEGGVEDFEPFVRYKEFGDSSINFSVILRVHKFVDKYRITHEFVKELFKTYNKEKIEIPFPQRDVWMRK
ncbi:mechanosensitive ion channel family protein, partial [Candidatus Woesearchaeota archaeon]|nr:mechanosensitive ion channel family protein [Candidatus Woesearchaeota archaeon]